jgi:hypothetical protein
MAVAATLSIFEPLFFLPIVVGSYFGLVAAIFFFWWGVANRFFLLNPAV